MINKYYKWRPPGEIKWKLSEIILEVTGKIIEPHKLTSNYPNVICYDGGVSWDGYAIDNTHIYSWDTMTAIVKAYKKNTKNVSGLVSSDYGIEICAEY